MKNKSMLIKLLPVAVAAAISSTASAGITLYDQDGTTFSADGHFNAFYTYQDSTDKTGSSDVSTKTSRVRMGFLPNYIGFNVAKDMGDLKVGGRSSFWVSINDSNQGSDSQTDSMIDVRQFYATVDGDFGQVLFGKDFGLYARSNIFSDELLLGVGLAPATSTNTTFGHITAGYPYANPVAQISYRTPVMSGFQLAVGLMDPNTTGTAAGQSNSARIETEATYSADYNGTAVKGWIGGAFGDSTTPGVDANGVAYGAQVKLAGFALTASGFDQEGISTAFASTTLATETESEGFLVQGSYSVGANRFVLSYGETETGSSVKAKNSLTGAAVFHDINENLKLVAEYTVNEVNNGTMDTSETDTFALGATLSW
jgi:hypothetical protein